MAEHEFFGECHYGFMECGVKIRSPAPDRVVKVSDNEVYADYGKYRQTWTAEGEGDERHNFKEKIEVIEE